MRSKHLLFQAVSILLTRERFDDCGNIVEIGSPRKLIKKMDATKTEQRLAAQALRDSASFKVLLRITLMTIVVFSLYALLVALLPSNKLSAAIRIGAFMISLLIMVCVQLQGSKTIDNIFTKRLLELRLCRVCGYNLKGLPSNNGCTTCPECGAKWKLNEE